MAAPRLRAKKNKSFYKSDSAYIDAVYRNNKAYIDSHMPKELLDRGVSPKAFFKAEVFRVKQQLNQQTGKKFTTNRAIKRVANSKMLNPEMTNSDIKANNFESLLKKDKERFKEFREKTRSRGRYTKFDYTKVAFNGYYTVNGSNAAVYQYDEDTVIIEYKSPQQGTGASYEVMDKGAFEQSLGKTIFGPFTAREMKY